MHYTDCRDPTVVIRSPWDALQMVVEGFSSASI